jgi:hypothetical protein
MLPPTVGRPVCLGVSPNQGPKTSILLLSDSCGFVDSGRPLWSSGPSPTGFMTVFCCLRFEASPTWRARSPYLYPPGTGFPFHRLLLLAWLRWRYSNPPPCGTDSLNSPQSLYSTDCSSLCSPDTGRTENTASNSSSVIACVSGAAVS